ncbi:MAG: hypothetical protein HN685_04060 [Waddliaceae bacterium]|nr:hypothetical protein [Waddliaceae bacterium]
MKYFKNIALFCILTMMTLSCGNGYQWGSANTLSHSYNTIHTPYVDGDNDGKLTAAIVRELETSTGGLSYQQHSGELILHVKILDSYSENIGYRHKKDDNDDSLENIIQVESRLITKVEVSIEETATGKIISGPTLIDDSVDYDYDFDSNRTNLLAYSLGQMTTNENARGIVEDPLNVALARKIVSYINHIW